MDLNYFGLLRSPVSWAKIGRELIGALIRQGDEVCVYERRGFGYNSKFKIQNSKLEQNIKNKFLYDRTLTFEHPSNYKYITSKQKFGMLVYETTQAPEQWAEKANAALDILFLPNGFNREIFERAGVKPEIIRVVPHGVNTEVFTTLNPEPGTRNEDFQLPGSDLRVENRFRFLCVAMPQRRKGIDVLVAAFKRVFAGNMDVELILKFPYMPGRSKYDIDMPLPESNISVIVDEFTEERMAGLYRSCDCFVLPSRAEGFGLVYLEALACGLPVIATAWGGHMGFLNDTNALLVKYKPADAAGIQYDNDGGAGLMAEPDAGDLSEKLEYAFQNRQELRKLPEKFDTVPYSWDNIARQMKQLIQKKSPDSRPPQP